MSGRESSSLPLRILKNSSWDYCKICYWKKKDMREMWDLRMLQNQLIGCHILAYSCAVMKKKSVQKMPDDLIMENKQNLKRNKIDKSPRCDFFDIILIQVNKKKGCVFWRQKLFQVTVKQEWREEGRQFHRFAWCCLKRGR